MKVNFVTERFCDEILSGSHLNLCSTKMNLDDFLQKLPNKANSSQQIIIMYFIEYKSMKKMGLFGISIVFHQDSVDFRE